MCACACVSVRERGSMYRNKDGDKDFLTVPKGSEQPQQWLQLINIQTHIIFLAAKGGRKCAEQHINLCPLYITSVRAVWHCQLQIYGQNC